MQSIAVNENARCYSYSPAQRQNNAISSSIIYLVNDATSITIMCFSILG